MHICIAGFPAKKIVFVALFPYKDKTLTVASCIALACFLRIHFSNVARLFSLAFFTLSLSLFIFSCMCRRRSCWRRSCLLLFFLSLSFQPICACMRCARRSTSDAISSSRAHTSIYESLLGFFRSFIIICFCRRTTDDARAENSLFCFRLNKNFFFLFFSSSMHIAQGRGAFDVLLTGFHSVMHTLGHAHAR